MGLGGSNPADRITADHVHPVDPKDAARRAARCRRSSRPAPSLGVAILVTVSATAVSTTPPLAGQRRDRVDDRSTAIALLTVLVALTFRRINR